MMIGSKPNVTGPLLMTSTIASGPAGMQNGHEAGTAESRKCGWWAVISSGIMKQQMRTVCLSSARIALLNSGTILLPRFTGSTCASVFHEMAPFTSGSRDELKSAALGRPSGPTGVYACNETESQASSHD